MQFALPNTKVHPIVMFDGVCNYCNSMVNFAIKWNKKKNIRYTPLQTEVGLHLRKKYNIDPTIDSVILIKDEKVYYFSSAALNIASQLSFPIYLLTLLKIVPPIIRDTAYKWIAKNRYKWFGKKDACMMPTKEMKSLFL